MTRVSLLKSCPVQGHNIGLWCLSLFSSDMLSCFGSFLKTMDTYTDALHALSYVCVQLLELFYLSKVYKFKFVWMWILPLLFWIFLCLGLCFHFKEELFHALKSIVGSVPTNKRKATFLHAGILNLIESCFGIQLVAKNMLVRIYQILVCLENHILKKNRAYSTCKILYPLLKIQFFLVGSLIFKTNLVLSIWLQMWLCFLMWVHGINLKFSLVP